MQLTLKFDFTTGDAITPNEIFTTYNTLFGDQINILAYNIETILAEKLQTIFYRGIGNTRLRDYYDVYILGSLKNDMIDVSVLKNAIRNTAEHRQTPNIFSEWQSTLEEFGNSSNLQSQWSRYVGENNYASGIAFTDALGEVEHLMKKVDHIQQIFMNFMHKTFNKLCINFT